MMHTKKIWYIHIFNLWTIHICIYPIPPHKQDLTQGHLLKHSLPDLNSEFYFSLNSFHSQVKEPSLPFYLPIAGRRIGY